MSSDSPREATSAQTELKAGREVDALVHSEVMGIQWDESRCRVCGWPLAANAAAGCVVGNCSMRRREHHGNADEPPAYSENIALAWAVVERLREKGWVYCTLQSCIGDVDVLQGFAEPRGVDWWAEFSRFRSADSVHCDDCDSPALAICLAALKAVEVSNVR